jgi:hypothetical protein
MTSTRDAGQAMLPLLVLVSLSLLVVTFSLLVPWGAATTEKAQAQTAADAAALAAVDHNREQWVRDTTAPGLGRDPGPGSLAQAQGRAVGRGCDRAEDYARLNDASVVSCRWSRGRGRGTVTVVVELDSTVEPRNGTARATARAASDIDIAGCRWTGVVPPATAADGGPPTFDDRLRCGPDYEVGYTFTNLPPYPSLAFTDGTTVRGLHNTLVPRLVR